MTSWKKNLYFVLVEPKEPGNIGASARAIKNMGFEKLILVNPAPLTDEAYWMAWASQDILENAEIYKNLDDALKDKAVVVGTTRRRGSKRGAIVDVRDGVKRIFEVAQDNKVAILFGREDKGLFNEEVEKCGFLITIPTSELQPSLNLAQAVLIVAYELMRCEEIKDFHMQRQFYVDQEELKKLYERLFTVLKKIGYIPEDPDLEKRIMNNFRHLFGRTGLTFWELKLLHGLCSHIEEKLVNGDII
ncbi:tRNA/rRNA methyltransferase [Thermodesulfovibrio aggregans]|uniref:tRNA (cytidine/uridine-2'-O-)-methyltransferase TrmJ n=1 Tax=Thermodesulfovibrio aggregans TaxID=86166 RepID=A0A0U9HYL4_9BACT|nr:RNA methyltransferase [Thermodesulfovibrio aggregans]GAQ95285.1 tRNA/rRNA methyltransferase [Thermodesulfovibrio aggregans]